MEVGSDNAKDYGFLIVEMCLWRVIPIYKERFLVWIFILTETKCLTLIVVMKQTLFDHDLDKALDKSIVPAKNL